MLSFLVCLNIELSEMGWILALHSLSGTQYAHKVSWGKAFSQMLTVFAMFDPRINIERIELTTQFFFQWSQLSMTNKWAKYDFVSTMHSYLKTTFSLIFCSNLTNLTSTAVQKGVMSRNRRHKSFCWRHAYVRAPANREWKQKEEEKKTEVRK